METGGGDIDWKLSFKTPATEGADPPNPDDEAPDTIGPYQVLERLGQGGMGVVYRARDSAASRDIALKLIGFAGDRAEQRRERFLREGELMARLDHPGIVRIHACGADGESVYLACELVEDCRDLRAAARELDREARVRLARDAASALGAAHRQGIVHRDVKPENLLVDSAGRLRVADFGLAWSVDVERLTRTGDLLGTPAYMAPERFEADRVEVEPAQDVWSLGVVLFELLVGEHPSTRPSGPG